MKRYSKQRACILENLKNREDHPTAEMVYESVRKEIPNISMGTVYRNLKELADHHKILCFTQNGRDHFDGKEFPHIHVCCTQCGKIEDHYIGREMGFLSAQGREGFTVQNVIVEGICSECRVKDDKTASA